MQVFKRYKKEIFISLVTGIVVFYFEPVLTYLGKVLINGFVLTSDSFSRFYYENLAENEPHGFSQSTNLLIIYGYFVFLLLYLGAFVRRRRQNSLHHIQHTITSLQKRKTRLIAGQNPDEEEAKDGWLYDSEAIQKEIDKLNSSLQNRQPKPWLLYIPAYCLLLTLILQHALTLAVNRENVRFKNQLIILAPHVADQDIKRLHAAWAGMENRQDYQRLNDQLKKFREQYELSNDD